MSRYLGLFAICVLPISVGADDWPQWFGPKRDGAWRDYGVLEKFPNGGPNRLWTAPLGAEYSGPVFANWCVFVRSDKEIVCASLEG